MFDDRPQPQFGIPQLVVLICSAGAWFLAMAAFSSVNADPDSPPSRFGKLTSRRWAYGAPYQRENLSPVKNPNPQPEPQPHRDHPFDVAVSADGRKVYISLHGSELEPGSEVAVYDLVQGKVIKRLSLKPAGESGPPASQPFRLALHPDGRFLLVTSRFSNFASVIDTRTDDVVSEIPLDFYCQGLAFDRDGKTAWVANRYLDQVFRVDIRAEGGSFQASLRELGGLDDQSFFRKEGIAPVLARRCGAAECHGESRGGFIAGADARASLLAAIPHVRPGRASESRLLRAVVRTRDGGYADAMPRIRGHAGGQVVFTDPKNDPDYQAIARWIDGASEGPGIPVSNPRSKPKVLALSSDGRFLFAGNTGSQDISIISTRHNRDVGGIYVQNVVNDVKIFHSPATGRDYLLATTLGAGFGVARERDPYGGESWDPSNPAAHFTVWRDLENGRVLPKSEQEVLGPFDAVDGTAGIKFRDVQNDLLLVDLDALNIPEEPPRQLAYLLLANRYESHRHWVRYTSDTAESTYGDVKGDIPPDLMRVVGSFPEKMALLGDRVYVTMQASNEVQEWKIDPLASDPSDYLVPQRAWTTGLQPIGIAAGPSGTPAEGKIFTVAFLGGTLTIIDTAGGKSREVVIDPSVERLPVPATNAERGEIFVHTALFSSDRDSSCMHCHYFDMGDGRPWGVSQVVGQEYISDLDAAGQLIIGGTMGVPQMRGLFAIQPFFLEGTLSAFEPRSMIMEHAPADDFKAPAPQGDFTAIEAHYALAGTDDVQSSMNSSSTFESSLEERRDEMFRQISMRYFGKAFTLRDFQRFVGEWQIHEPRLLPNPFDPASASVRRGRELFNNPQVGCVSCHPPPHFAKKDFPNNPAQALPPLVTLTVRDGAFTLVGMNRLDAVNGFRRDLEPWDIGRAEEAQGHFTTLQLRGLWDRPPVFLHNGMARSLREVLAAPGHPALQTFRYEPLIGGVPERPGLKEIGFNETFFFTERSPKVKMHLKAGARLGSDTHGGTSQLTALQIDDLANFLESIE
ncbi:MAG: hypothetical protein HY717_01745 [Planctomycetes bacterium]|nr:hypothetical protein [Planctomycetota bacterium]